MEHITRTQNIYPKIEDLKDPNTYRLATAREILTSLQREVEKYEGVIKKYKKLNKTFAWIGATSSTLSLGLSAAGVGISLTGPGAIVGIPLGVLGGVSGLTAFASGFFVKRFGRSIAKHENTVVLARSKMYSILDLVNKAITDGKISEEEYTLINKESQSYHTQKLEIRKKSQQSLQKGDPLSQSTVIRKEVAEQMTKNLLEMLQRK